MKFRTHGTVQGHPEFTLAMKSHPVDFDAGAEGSLKVATGPIDARIDAVTVTLVIPFLHRRSARVVGSIGPFGVHVEPFDVQVRDLGIHVAGVLGKEGMQCHVDGQMACHMELDLHGDVPGRITKAAIELTPDDGGEES